MRESVKAGKIHNSKTIIVEAKISSKDLELSETIKGEIEIEI